MKSTNSLQTPPRRLSARVAVAAGIVVATLVSVGAATPDLVHRDGAIPAFARKYRTTCTTCHVAPPKLNVLGETFRLNGYRFPGNDELLRQDDPVTLGAPEWRDLWPRAVWPGELPETVPLAMRLTNDINLRRPPGSPTEVELVFPLSITLLAATSLGDALSVFVETEIEPTGEVELEQAKLMFRNIIPSLPPGRVNLMIGLQNQRLLTFADRAIDMAGREVFSWQDFRVADLTLTGPGLLQAEAGNVFHLGGTRPSLELNGLATRRLYYGLGLAQDLNGNLTGDRGQGQLYYKLRYKFGGLALDGTYDEGALPTLGGGGQLQDQALILEHFGYFGRAGLADGSEDPFRAFGVAARGLAGPLDVGVGYVWGRDDAPFGLAAPGGLSHRGLFAKAEYQMFPWLFGTLKYDDFAIDAPTLLSAGRLLQGNIDRSRLVPGFVGLIRHNVRVVLEVEYGVTDAIDPAARGRLSNAWLRLDMAF